MSIKDVERMLRESDSNDEMYPSKPISNKMSKFIISPDKKNLINLDRVFNIYVDNNYVCFKGTYVDTSIKFDTKEEAQEYLLQIYQNQNKDE